ncbi:MAG: carbon storage regulator [Ktedonobacterales bacterium]
MLVLRRKAGEAIVLNGVITIHVLAVEGERVKLGISAPPEVVIVRSELLENQGAMGGPGNSYSNVPSPMRGGTAGPRPYHTQDNDMRGPGIGPQQAGYSRYTTPRPSYPSEPGEAPSPFPSGPLRYRP